MTTGQDLAGAARRYVGVPYLYGGKDGAGLDCSGLIWLALADLGVPFVHGSSAQIDACQPISVEEGWATPGALLWREGHDAISTGSGTVEAIRPAVSELGRSDTYAGAPRFTRAGLIPGIDYSQEASAMARMSSPVKGHVSSEYGTRNGTLHAGIDIATGGKSGPVHATFAGVVEKIVRGRKHGETSRANEIAPFRTGNGIIVRNPDGERQVYVHTLAPASLKVGDKVSVGTVIGKTDLSGNTTGYHCHYEEWTKSGATRNPRASFKAFDVVPGATPVKASAPAPKPKPAPAIPGNLTASVKKALARMGLPPTIAGIKSFQRAHGLVADGYWGKVTERYYKWVRAFQTYLNLISTVQPKLVVDGFYGAKTRNARRVGSKARGYNPPDEPAKRG